MREEHKVLVTEIITQAVDGLITVDEAVIKIAAVLNTPTEQAAE